MKILNVTSHQLFPVSEGGRAHAYTQVKELLSKKNSVTLYSPDKEVTPGEKDPSLVLYKKPFTSSKSKFISPVVLYNLKRLSREHDKVILDYPWFALHCIILRIPYEVREHNVEFLRFKSYKSWYWRFLYFYERIAYKNAQEVLAISKEDKDLLQEKFNLSPQCITVTPYEPDTSKFRSNKNARQVICNRLDLDKDTRLFLFFGKLDYEPNKEALEILVNEIVPRLNALAHFQFKIVICGKNPPPIKSRHIVTTGYVEKIEHYIQACDLMLNPIISGGGVKTKVLETLACEKKVISTKTGAKGIPDQALLIQVEEDWEQFVGAIMKNI